MEACQCEDRYYVSDLEKLNNELQRYCYVVNNYRYLSDCKCPLKHGIVFEYGHMKLCLPFLEFLPCILGDDEEPLCTDCHHRQLNYSTGHLISFTDHSKDLPTINLPKPPATHPAIRPTPSTGLQAFIYHKEGKSKS